MARLDPTSEGGTVHHSNTSPPASDREMPRRAPAEGGGDPNTGDGEEEEEEELLYPWQLPSNAGIVGIIWWALMLPVNFLLFLTIPDMR